MEKFIGPELDLRCFEPVVFFHGLHDPLQGRLGGCVKPRNHGSLCFPCFVAPCLQLHGRPGIVMCVRSGIHGINTKNER